MAEKILKRKMSIGGESPCAAMNGDASGSIECESGEIMLFGVRVKVDPMRKSMSMNNLSEYEPVSGDKNYTGNNRMNDSTYKASEAGNVGVDGYASADDVMPRRANVKRKRGVPWTEDEHKLFLIGLHKVGKGDWRGISKNYVKTRTPTQVASHAQKYFIRQSNVNHRRRRRNSLFDITTTDSVAAMPIGEGKNNHQSPVRPLPPPPPTPSLLASMTISPAPFSMQYEYPKQISTVGHRYGDSNSAAMLVDSVSVEGSRTIIDLNLNQQAPMDPAPTSPSLSQPSKPDRSLKKNDSGSAFQVIPGLKTGDSLISVV